MDVVLKAVGLVMAGCFMWANLFIARENMLEYNPKPYFIGGGIGLVIFGIGWIV